MKTETGLNQKVVSAIERHYKHAKERHSYFCDIISPQYFCKAQAKRICADKLKDCRDFISEAKSKSRLRWDALLNCEVWEVHESITNGDNAHAIEECYDAIAVILRVIDVLEGRQELGRPKEGEK